MILVDLKHISDYTPYTYVYTYVHKLNRFSLRHRNIIFSHIYSAIPSHKEITFLLLI